MGQQLHVSINISYYFVYALEEAIQMFQHYEG